MAGMEVNLRPAGGESVAPVKDRGRVPTPGTRPQERQPLALPPSRSSRAKAGACYLCAARIASASWRISTMSFFSSA